MDMVRVCPLVPVRINKLAGNSVNATVGIAHLCRECELQHLRLIG